MSNMSYCRFENTLADLRDCEEAMGENLEDLSESERKARERLLLMCARIAADFEDEIEEIHERKAATRKKTSA